MLIYSMLNNIVSINMKHTAHEKYLCTFKVKSSSCATNGHTALERSFSEALTSLLVH